MAPGVELILGLVHGKNLMSIRIDSYRDCALTFLSVSANRLGLIRDLDNITADLVLFRIMFRIDDLCGDIVNIICSEHE